MVKDFGEMFKISIYSRIARWTSSYARCWQSVRRRRLLQEMRKQQQTTIENIPLRGPEPHQSLLKCPMGVALKLEMDKVAKAVNTLTVLAKLLHRLRGIV